MKELLKFFQQKINKEDIDYNPYCEVCNGCGENGCCDPLKCDPTNPKCKYPDVKDIEIRGLREYIKELEKK